jgi:murein DD-endopeptidase MepM/ murein hydrolase activator NlpD
MKNNKFVSAVFTALTITSGAIGLNALSAVTPLTQSAQAAYYANCPFTVRIYQPTNVRPEPNTSKAAIASLSKGSVVWISTFVDGQAIYDTAAQANDIKWFKLRDQAGYVASAVVDGYPPTSDCKSGWKLPWRSGDSIKVNGGWHTDGFNGTTNAVDFGLKAGTPVLAPVNATVVSFCKATNDNHLGIKFRTDDGKYFAIAHVKSTSVSNGTRFTQGQQIGVVASDTPWNACAQSTGVHLHVGLPSQNMKIDGYDFSPSSIPSYVKSTNN